MSLHDIRERLECLLSSRGLSAVEISRLIKDTANIVGDGNGTNLFLINEKLSDLGWPRHVLDEHDLELIMYFNEIQESSDRGMLHSIPTKTKQGLHTVFVG
ncbi:MAG TPA: hypothetical protein PKM59_03340 [Thermodesulfobacteriota bacterium]|nr:hypothetical protein [Deltaproteobacteria bacterium]HNR12330.1 hypothetical protein [Thermodesulfobacteriota bacterium]HNU71285.1 hypothetical protein [Thermodesulfobacteriota bacterium]